MQSENTATSLVRKRPMSEVSHSIGRPTVTAMQFRRIVESLEAGHAERNIAASESIPEIVVRRIRQLELDRRDRQMSAVGLAFGSFMDHVRQLHKEIDEGCYEEIQEGAA